MRARVPPCDAHAIAFPSRMIDVWGRGARHPGTRRCLFGCDDPPPPPLCRPRPDHDHADALLPTCAHGAPPVRRPARAATMAAQSKALDLRLHRRLLQTLPARERQREQRARDPAGRAAGLLPPARDAARVCAGAGQGRVPAARGRAAAALGRARALRRHARGAVRRAHPRAGRVHAPDDGQERAAHHEHLRLDGRKRVERAAQLECVCRVPFSPALGAADARAHTHTDIPKHRADFSFTPLPGGRTAVRIAHPRDSPLYADGAPFFTAVLTASALPAVPLPSLPLFTLVQPPLLPGRYPADQDGAACVGTDGANPWLAIAPRYKGRWALSWIEPGLGGEPAGLEEYGDGIGFPRLPGMWRVGAQFEGEIAFPTSTVAE
jgi:hypothetical protein